MAWALLVYGVWALVSALNALAPRRGPLLVFAWSFFSSWLVIELVWHHLLIGIAFVAATVAGGALDQPAGVVGLVLSAIALALLAAIGWTTRRTKVTVGGALVDLDPEDEAPRFSRASVILPFLMGRRRGVHTRRNLTYARVAGRALKLDVTVPSAPVPGAGDRRPALVQVHGGGWMIGDKREQGLPLLRHMAAQGWVGFNVNYRLSPAATFPDHLVDVKRAIAWIREHADDFGVDPGFVCITGGSAGGHLTALAALTAEDRSLQPGFEAADTSVAAAVPFYGVYDFTPHGAFGADTEVFRRFLEPFVMKAFVAEEPERYAEASPIHRVHAGAPPFFVIHGDRDTLAPVEDARAFVERLRAVSQQPVLYAEMQGAQHAFEVFPSVRAARVIEGVERFLSTLWARRGQTSSAEGRLEDALTD
ncbi:MAG: alpha/beta hydrolase fold domain-containing protein [Acidimicrobiia bacterium]|jgi:acetyl esterase/lipase